MAGLCLLDCLRSRNRRGRDGQPDIDHQVGQARAAAAFALNRVAGNVGIGSGATVAGFIVASAQQLSTFQALYFLDAVTYAGFALIVFAAVPSPRAETVTRQRPTQPAFAPSREIGCS